MSRPTAPSAHPTNATHRLLRAAARAAVEALERRTLLSGSPPRLDPPASGADGLWGGVTAAYHDADAADTFTLDIDWGDGTVQSNLWTDPGRRTAGYDHLYSSPGTYAGTLTVRDAAGLTDTQAFSVTVADTGPGGLPPSLGDEPPPAEFVGPTAGLDFADSSLTGEGTTPPPHVTAVHLDSSQWAPGFRDHLYAYGLGDWRGFALPPADPAGPLQPLPWSNLDRLRVTFSEDVNVDWDDLRLTGTDVPEYATSNFSYDPATLTATWDLSAPLAADKLLIDLDGDSAAAVTGAATGVLLDGDAATTTLHLPSGDGEAGGDFALRFDVLPGDVDRDGGVDLADTEAVRDRQGTSPASPGTPPNTYTAFHDPNGSGAVNIFDTLAVRNLDGTARPAAAPGLPAAPAALRAVAGDASVTLAWTESDGAESYNVYYGTAGGVGGPPAVPQLTRVGGPSWTIKGLTNGTGYFFRVTAVGPGGESGPSAEATATPAASAAAPRALSDVVGLDGWTEFGRKQGRIPRGPYGTGDAILVQQPAHGTVYLEPDGDWTYAPDESWVNGPEGDGTQLDRFLYKLNNGTSDSNIASVVLRWKMEPLWANHDRIDARVNPETGAYDSEFGGVVTLNVLANDGVTPNLGPRAKAVLEGGTTSAGGTVQMREHGTFVYHVPSATYAGVDTFTYHMEYSGKQSNVATVHLVVDPQEDPNVFYPTVWEEGPVVGRFMTGVFHDTTTPRTVGGDAASHYHEPGERWNIPGGTALGGQLFNHTAWTADYLPPAGVSGWDYYEHALTEGDGQTSLPARAWIEIMNNVPSMEHGGGATPRDTPLTDTVPLLQTNSTTETYHLAYGPAHGDVELDAATGAYTYTPAGGYVGKDLFTYYASDGGWDGALVTVFLDVTPVSAPPKPDLDVDSLNDNGLLLPDNSRTEREDAVEDDAGKPGKYVQVGGGVPMALEIPSGSSPLAEYRFNITGGTVRVETATGTRLQNGTGYTAFQLGVVNGIAPLVVKAGAAGPAGQRIVVEVDPDGFNDPTKGFEFGDAVRVTPGSAPTV